MKKVLIVAPHADDAELGCGGVAQVLSRQDVKVSAMILGAPRGSEDVWIEEAKKANEVLNYGRLCLPQYPYMALQFHARTMEITKFIQTEVDQSDIDVVFCPARDDDHQDHQVVLEACRVAACGKSLIGYITPNRRTNVSPNWFVPITHQQLNTKVEACHCYRRVRNSPYFESAILRAQAQFYGALCREPYAEGFIIEWLKGI